jgi:hypothetical protein
MTFIAYVKIEAVDDLIRTLEGKIEPTRWLESRLKLVTQSTAEWVPVILNEDSWYWIKDNFGLEILTDEARS